MNNKIQGYADFISKQASEGIISEEKIDIDAIGKKAKLSPFQTHMLKGMHKYGYDAHDEADLAKDQLDKHGHSPLHDLNSVEDVHSWASDMEQRDHNYFVNHAKKFFKKKKS